jgi:hypothetical protein
MSSSNTRRTALAILWPVLAFLLGGALVHYGWLLAWYRDLSASAECSGDNLRMLHVAFSAYAEDHDGTLPPAISLRDLAGEWSHQDMFRGDPVVHCDLSGPLGAYIDSEVLLQCDGDPAQLGPDGARPSYVWSYDLAARQWSDLAPGNWLLRDRAGWHWGNEVNALDVDGSLRIWRYAEN